VGVFAGGGINFAAISSEMRSTMLPWFNASIQIVDPNVGSVEWNVVTNTKTSGTPTVLWSGYARVQHLRSDRTPDVGFSQTDIRGVRIQLPLDVELGLIRKGLQVIVTDGGSDPVLEQLGFVIRSSINSSYAWGRTIECDVDLKSISNSTWSSISGNVKNVGSENLVNINVRSFHLEDGVWLLDYETTTDTSGNYELPADVGVPVIVGVFKSGYVSEYWNNSLTTAGATTITPVNQVGTLNINFVMAAN
jgi:hypothetical protein